VEPASAWEAEEVVEAGMIPTNAAREAATTAAREAARWAAAKEAIEAGLKEEEQEKAAAVRVEVANVARAAAAVSVAARRVLLKIIEANFAEEEAALTRNKVGDTQKWKKILANAPSVAEHREKNAEDFITHFIRQPTLCKLSVEMTPNETWKTIYKGWIAHVNPSMVWLDGGGARHWLSDGEGGGGEGIIESLHDTWGREFKELSDRESWQEQKEQKELEQKEQKELKQKEPTESLVSRATNLLRKGRTPVHDTYERDPALEQAWAIPLKPDKSDEGAKLRVKLLPKWNTGWSKETLYELRALGEVYKERDYVRATEVYGTTSDIEHATNGFDLMIKKFSNRLVDWQLYFPGGTGFNGEDQIYYSGTIVQIISRLDQFKNVIAYKAFKKSSDTMDTLAFKGWVALFDQGAISLADVIDVKKIDESAHAMIWNTVTKKLIDDADQCNCRKVNEWLAAGSASE